MLLAAALFSHCPTFLLLSGGPNRANAVPISQGMNNFKSMPLLPGANEPIALKSAQVKKAAKSKASKGNNAGGCNPSSSTRGVKKKGNVDPRLEQLDLQRAQVKAFDRADSCPRVNTFSV